jgi:hypothetical protein
MHRILICLVLILVVCVAPAAAPAQNASASGNAGVTLSRASVKAGEKINMTLVLDSASSYEGSIQAIFSNNSNGLICNAPIRAGEKVFHCVMQTQMDSLGGVYQLAELVIHHTTRSTSLKFDPISFELIPTSGLVDPTSVQVAIVPDLKQYMRTKAEDLQGISDELNKKLLVDKGSPDKQKNDLSDALTQADSTLLKTKAEYLLIVGKTVKTSPIFFDDFHRNYVSLEYSVRPVKSARQSMLVDKGHVVFVQQKIQPKSATKTNGRKQKNQDSADAVLALISSVLHLIKENIEAFNYFQNAISDMFTLDIASKPSGASISCSRIGELAEPLSSPTVVHDIKLPLALWTFQFTKKGCITLTEPFDPYIDAIKILSVDLTCKGKK